MILYFLGFEDSRRKTKSLPFQGSAIVPVFFVCVATLSYVRIAWKIPVREVDFGQLKKAIRTGSRRLWKMIYYMDMELDGHFAI